MILVGVQLTDVGRQAVVCVEVGLALAVAPAIKYDSAWGQVRYTGKWSVLHIPTGLPLRYDACYPCAVRAAVAAEDCDLEWSEVEPGEWWTPERQAKVAAPMEILLSCQHIQAVTT